jgi:tetratricopeptide (TPR) repeat protein
LLKPLEPTFLSFVDSHFYYGELAKCYEQLGKLTDAAVAWSKARVLAERFPDKSELSYYVMAEVAALARVGKASRADADLRNALLHESDPARRIELLSLRAELLDRSKHGAEVERLFAEAMAFCTAHGLKDKKSDLLVVIGDYRIHDSYKDEFEAIKIYTKALIHIISKDIGEAEKLMSDIAITIASPGSPVTIKELDRLLLDLEKELRSTFKSSDRVVNFLLVPIRFARRLAPFRKFPRKFVSEAEKCANDTDLLLSSERGN